MTVAVVATIASVAVAQAQPAMRMFNPGQGGHNQWEMMRNQRLTAENGVQYTGVVKSAADAPMAGVQVVAYAPKTGYVYTAKSDKNGKFKMLLLPDTQYVVEFTTPGYKKFAAVCDAKGEPIEGQPVVLTPSVEGIENMKGKSPLVVGELRNIQITMSKHPVNNERSLVDLINELPGFEISPEAFFAFVNPRTEIRINNQLLRVRPQALYSYFSNIEAKALRVLRVSWANQDNKEAAQVYMTIDE